MVSFFLLLLVGVSFDLSLLLKVALDLLEFRFLGGLVMEGSFVSSKLVFVFRFELET